MPKIDLTGDVDGVKVEQADIKLSKSDTFDAIVSVRADGRTITGHVIMPYHVFAALDGADHAERAAAVRRKMVEVLTAKWPDSPFRLWLGREDGTPTLQQGMTGVTWRNVRGI